MKILVLHFLWLKLEVWELESSNNDTIIFHSYWRQFIAKQGLYILRGYVDLTLQNSHLWNRDFEANDWGQIIQKHNSNWREKLYIDIHCILCFACCPSQIVHFLQIEGLWQPSVKQVCQRSFFLQHLFASCLYVMFW